MQKTIPLFLAILIIIGLMPVTSHADNKSIDDTGEDSPKEITVALKYNPPDGDNGHLSGLLGFRNLYKAGRNMEYYRDFYGNSLKDISFNEFKYHEPKLFNMSLDMDFHFIYESEKYRQLEMYEFNRVSVLGEFNFQYSFSKAINALFRFGQSLSNITQWNAIDREIMIYTVSCGALAEIPEMKKGPVKGGEDNILVGWRLSKSTETTESRAFLIDADLEIRGSFDHEFLFNIARDVSFSMKPSGAGIFTKGYITSCEYFKLGGMRNLRGHIENQFRGTRKLLLNNDLKMRFDETSYSSFFCDIGLCWTKEDSWQDVLQGLWDGTSGGIGYGMAVDMNMPFGSIGVSIGLNHRDNIWNLVQEAKVSVKVVIKG